MFRHLSAVTRKRNTAVDRKQGRTGTVERTHWTTELSKIIRNIWSSFLIASLSKDMLIHFHEVGIADQQSSSYR